MFLIYAPKKSSRLLYITDFIFREIFGIEFRSTTDKTEFQQHASAKLNYSDAQFSSEPFIYSSNLLFEKGIREQELNFNLLHETPVLFYSHPRYEFPFDIFAASFYLITRYEEYLPHLRDNHDRYLPNTSVASKKNFVNKPVVDIWAYQLRNYLKKFFPDLKFRERQYRFISTIDIDNAFAYLEKGFMRTTGAYLRSLMKLELKDFKDRLYSHLGLMYDPFDTYAMQLDIQKKYNLRTIYFFLLGDYDLNDKNVSASSFRFRSLIKYLADYSDAGIHPSFASSDSPQKVKIEILRLSKIVRRDIRKSRQHFLKLKFPQTYRTLIENDITDDYTMGYAHTTGFRAGTCTSYRFYDLDNEEMTSLNIHPFAVMDATLKYYLKLSPEESLVQIGQLIQEIKKVDGTFISLWHNESLSDYKEWKGWKYVFEEMIKLAVK
ncbi:MAG TPA: polysaccharide deacetylase family protein [Bacteroidia bacterium]|nr:polysaccharide deacetylase family protein [Bacteroidia bacterium]